MYITAFHAMYMSSYLKATNDNIMPNALVIQNTILIGSSIYKFAYIRAGPLSFIHEQFSPGALSLILDTSLALSSADNPALMRYCVMGIYFSGWFIFEILRQIAFPSPPFQPQEWNVPIVLTLMCAQRMYLHSTQLALWPATPTRNHNTFSQWEPI